MLVPQGNVALSRLPSALSTMPSTPSCLACPPTPHPYPRLGATEGKSASKPTSTAPLPIFSESTEVEPNMEEGEEEGVAVAPPRVVARAPVREHHDGEF